MSLAIPALSRLFAELEALPFEAQARVLRAGRRELADWQAEQEIEDCVYRSVADVAQRLKYLPGTIRQWVARYPDLRALGRRTQAGAPLSFRTSDVREWANSHGKLRR